MTAPSGRLSDAIGTAVGFAIRRPWLTALSMLGLTVLGWLYTAENLEIDTDTADMISPELDWRQDFIAYRDSFPARDRNIVAVVDAQTADASLDFARDLAAALAAEPAIFPTVFLAGQGEFFERNGLLYLPLAELETLVERLIAAQPLLGRLSRDPSGAGILGVVAEALAASEGQAETFAVELDGLLRELERTIAASAAGEREPIAWNRLIGFAADTSTRQLILIQPTLDFARMRPAREAIDRIREIGDTLAAGYSEPVELRLTGTLAMEHEELSSVTRSAAAAGIAALVMVVIVLLWALRSLRLLAVAVVTLLSGLVLTASFAAATVGHLNLLSVAFAVLYVGLGVDFILHLGLRLRELGRDGLPLEPALIETARGVGSSLLICAITTAVGFLAFVPTDFDGIAELGLISGGGMFISLLVSLTLLPALIRLFWRERGTRVATGGPVRLKLRITLPPRATCIAAALIALVAVALLPGLEFDGNPVKLRDPDAESIRALEDLANDSEAPLFNLAVVVPDAAAAAALAVRLAPLETVERVQTAASLVPADQEDKLFALEDAELALGAALARFEPVGSDPERIRPALDEIAAALAALDAPGAAAQALLEAVAAAQAHFATLDADAAARAAVALDADLQGDLVEEIGRLANLLDARPFDLADLPAELRDRWINPAGEQLVEIVPSENLNDSEAAKRFVAEVRRVAPNATGLPVVYEEAAATVTRAFATALGYAFVAVALMLVAFMRSFRDATLVLVPILFAAVVTAAASVLFDLPLNFANIIALPLLVGVGVDSGIHMVHRMRTEPPKDGDPLHTSTSRAVLASALTTIASFGNLAFSSHLGMASMGQLLTIGMATSVAAVLGLLPAMMRLTESR